MKTYQELLEKVNKKIIKLTNKIIKNIEREILKEMKRSCLYFGGTNIEGFGELKYQVQDEIKRRLDEAGFSCYRTGVNDNDLRVFLKTNK